MSRRRSRAVPLLTAALFVTSMVTPGAVAAQETSAKGRGDDGWQLLYAEDFSKPLPTDTQWRLENFSDPFDTITDDNGLWYENDYGQAWTDQMASFRTYRKDYSFGTNGWLTASLSARDWNADGVIEDEPTISTGNLRGEGQVASIDVPDHTGGAIFRPTNQLPQEYRIEYKLKTLDFGGKRGGEISYDGRENGYSTEGCKTQHPWGEGPRTPGWEGDASAPYCEWQDVRSGPYGYNGYHFMTIVDFADPAPRNNHFWHYHRKVLMDSFAQHPDRVGNGTGGRICDAKTKTYYNYRDSNYNTVNMWISGMPNYSPGEGGLAGNSQWFMTSCSDGKAEQQLSTAGEMLPELMPKNDYTIAIERSKTAYTLEISGLFARSGQQTFRFTRPFVVDGKPIWHYNVTPDEYDGQFDGDLKQNGVVADRTWTDQWAKGSAYPDYFVIGDLYTNVYEGKASLDDIKLFVPKKKR